MTVPLLSGFPLIRRTAHEVVVVKPADVPSESSHDESRTEGRSVVATLRAALPDADPQLPHRLDRPTRGLLVIALSRDAVARHNEHIRNGRWKKFYLARVPEGAPLIGEHRAFLRREGRSAAIVRSGGDPARLEVLAEGPAPKSPGERHLLIRLDTGRYHQIRAMFASLGAPLTGDVSYGGRPGPMYLEHAVLVFVDLDSGEPCRLHWPDDPQREALDPALATALASCAAGSIGSIGPIGPIGSSGSSGSSGS